MKATGIVRRMDDLGRVVIPKEIRRTLRIREGDPLEIFTESDGGVIFKKYSPIGELDHYTADYADVLCRTGGRPVLICDKEQVVAAAGIPKREVLERRVSPLLEDAMKMRRELARRQESDDFIKPVEGLDRFMLVSCPIIAQSDVCGAVLFLSEKEGDVAGAVQVKLCEAAAGFLARQLEG
jgi:AbrB family transcriptional regulator (stage V sporulation protein T)